MQYKSFRIQNFKGIKDTTVKFRSVAGASVFAFVGLNESGKTTVLEAIHSFSPDDATSELLGGETGTGVPIKERVPRHQLSEFTGSVKITATLSVSEADKLMIAKRLLREQSITVDKAALPDEVIFTREQQFIDGDLKHNFFTLLTEPLVKTGKQRKWRKPIKSERIAIRDIFYERTPDIAYFPTFIFDFPDRFYLTDRGDDIDQFYRRVFQDILDYDGRGQTIEKDIVRRVRQESMKLPWLSFLPLWGRHDDRDKIQHVMDRASAAVTKLVFGRWDKIFGEDTKGKEILVSYEVEEGEVEDETGTLQKTSEHDVVAKFQIKDGTRRFNVNDRSLGFRWFFSFMLFTQFRVARSGSESRPLLFLFDEPASNLHAAAQQRLIDSFPEIAKGEHVLAYSTHSHYMIEPKWLEQTFIVSNRSDAPPDSVLDEISLDDESLDVQVSTYRAFVNEHPGQTTYFQPILDRLDVVPSRFDMLKPSVVLEGKSDYYVLRFAQDKFAIDGPPLLPGLGAGTFGALVALHLAWGVNFLFVLDDDVAGNKEKDRYAKEFGVNPERLLTIGGLSTGVREIEDLLDHEARAVISSSLSITKKPSKSQIQQFFQEKLAQCDFVDLGTAFEEHALKILTKMKDLLLPHP